MENKKMTKREAGRLGGKKLLKERGPDYFKELSDRAAKVRAKAWQQFRESNNSK